VWRKVFHRADRLSRKLDRVHRDAELRTDISRIHVVSEQLSNHWNTHQGLDG
jgi:hypothetical protein